MIYNNYRYIYPPRPKNSIPPDELDFWDNDTLVSQPKLNGSNCIIFTNGIESFVMNRHNQKMVNFKLTKNEILSLYKGNGWMVINGEYMNKSKKDKYDQIFNHKFVIFDILVYNSDYLIGKTFKERINLINKLYNINNKSNDSEFLYKISDNIYFVKSYYENFKSLYNSIISIDMYEGLVLKRKNAKLEIVSSSSNNHKSQLKCRKPTKNYKY